MSDKQKEGSAPVVIRNCLTCAHEHKGECLLVGFPTKIWRQEPFEPCNVNLSGWVQKPNDFPEPPQFPPQVWASDVLQSAWGYGDPDVGRPSAMGAAWRMQRIAYQFLAWVLGGTVHHFEGRDRAGRWHGGLCILSHGALVAHKVVFRSDARVYSDTALLPVDVKASGGDQKI